MPPCGRGGPSPGVPTIRTIVAFEPAAFAAIPEASIRSMLVEFEALEAPAPSAEPERHAAYLELSRFSRRLRVELWHREGLRPAPPLPPWSFFEIGEAPALHPVEAP